MCLYLIPLDLIFLYAFLIPTIQKSSWKIFLTNSLPSCRLSRWAFSNRICTTGCFAVNNIGCFALQSRFECFSPAFTLIFPCSSMKIDSLAMFNVLEISLLFAIDFETFGKPSLWTNGNSICSAWWISSALRGPFCFVLNLIQLAMNFLIPLKVVYLDHSNSWSSLVSAAKGLVTCSASTSFIWHHGFGHFSASDWSHAGPFIYTDSAVMPSMDIPWVPMSAGFLTSFTCLHGSIDEFSSVSAVLFATNVCCLWSNNLGGPIFVPASSWNIILPTPAIGMASSALKIAGTRFLLCGISFPTDCKI